VTGGVQAAVLSESESALLQATALFGADLIPSWREAKEKCDDDDDDVDSIIHQCILT